MINRKYGDSIKIAMLASLVLGIVPAWAQDANAPAAKPSAAVPIASTSSDAPIEITAGRTLEWHRNDNKYIARGQVEAKQGDTAIYSETLTADYRDGVKSSMEIYLLTAEEDVRVQNTTTTIYGQKAVYDVDKAHAVMTGDNLKMISPDQTVTARDRMEYFSTTHEAIAVGNAKVVRTKDTLNADVVKAIFKETANGQEIDTLHANGHVVIVTPTETLTGDNGIYHSSTNTAQITGNVRIVRGQNILEGDRADVDLNTNISKIFGGPSASAGAGDGRVRGVFYPGSDKSPPAGAPSQIAPSQVTPPQTAPTPAPQGLAPVTNPTAPVVTAPAAPLKSPPLFAPTPQGAPQ